MPRARHPKKDVEAALQFAEANGWTVTPTTRGHRWGKAECANGCSVSIWSTPKNAQNHAKHIQRAVARCPH